MQTTRARGLWLALGAAAIIVAGVLAFALTTGGSEEHSHGTDHGPLGPTPESAEAGAAAKYALTAMFSWQPATDASPGAGLTRAAPWLTGHLAAEAAAPPATGIRPLAEWAGWRAAGDIVTALVTVTATSPPTGGQATAAAQVRQLVQHRDNTTSTPWRDLTVTATLTETPEGWRLSSYTVTG
ncbi:hypothetical protein [Nocardia sp. NPDC050435]|uniref:hypothetical protein n=1 Tax=Nocardia sp. NPDC050435 TaxID=3155040 RepID=UPI0033C91762